MHLLLDRQTKQLQTFYLNKSIDVEGTGQQFVWPWPQNQGKLMYFHVNVFPPKPLDV